MSAYEVIARIPRYAYSSPTLLRGNTAWLCAHALLYVLLVTSCVAFCVRLLQHPEDTPWNCLHYLRRMSAACLGTQVIEPDESLIN